MNNSQAVGYMLLACKDAGISKEQAKELYRRMYYAFDIKTESEAERDGFAWYYSNK